MARVIGIGAGGHARVLLEALASNPAHVEHRVVALVDDDPALTGTTVGGVVVHGRDADLARAIAAMQATHFFVGVGGVGRAGDDVRARLFAMGTGAGLAPLTIAHASALVSPSARVGAGCQLLARAVIGTGVVLGDDVIVNTGAFVDHDCVIEAHAHIATGAALAAQVHVGSGAHVGVGAAVRQGIRIGANAVVGAGAAVVKDVAASVTVVGVPARVMPP